MPSINFQASYSARYVGGAAVLQGYAVCRTADGQAWTTATTAALAAIGAARAHGVALATVTHDGVFPVQITGQIDASIVGVGPGADGDYVESSPTGTLVRNASPTAKTVGVADAFGNVTLSPPGIGAGNATVIQGVPIAAPVQGLALGYNGASLAWRAGASRNILDFAGADPTGATPSDAAFDAALASLGSTGGVHGGTIEMPPGHYVFTATKNLGHFSSVAPVRSGIRVRGAGGGNSYPASLTTVEFRVPDVVIKTGLTISAPDGSGFQTITGAAGSFNAAAFDRSVRTWGWPNNANNVMDLVVCSVGPATDGTQITVWNPGGAADAGGCVCVGTGIGFESRTGDSVLENLLVMVGANTRMTALFDWTESNQTGHIPLTRCRTINCKFATINYADSRLRFGVRVGRTIALPGGPLVPFFPYNLDYFKAEHCQFWTADDAHWAVMQHTGQSRTNEFYSCDFVYGSNAIYALNGTQFDLHSCSFSGNGPIRSMECALVVNGSGPPCKVFGFGSEGVSGYIRAYGSPFVVVGADWNVGVGSIRPDGMLCDLGNNPSPLTLVGVQVDTNSISNGWIRGTSVGAYENTVNLIGCAVPTNTRAVDYNYNTTLRQGPFRLADGDTLTFGLDAPLGVTTHTVTFHATGTIGVPLDVDGLHRWRYGIDEAQAWEVAQVIETALGSGACVVGYGDHSQIDACSLSATGPLGSGALQCTGGTAQAKIGFTAGYYLNSAMGPSSRASRGFVGPNDIVCNMIGTGVHNLTTGTREGGGNSFGPGGKGGQSGTLTVAVGATSAVVVFPTALPTGAAQYLVEVTCTSDGGTLGAGRVRSIAKTNVGFTLNVEAAPAVTAATFDWVVRG